MPINLDTPMIVGASTAEQLEQIKQYLFKTAEQLNYAFNYINNELPSTSTNGVVTRSSSVRTNDKSVMTEQEATFNSIRDLIINSAEIVAAYSDAIQKRLNETYVAQSPYGKYMEEIITKLQLTAKSFTQTIEDTQIIEQEGEQEGVHVYGKVKIGIVDEANRLIGVEIGQETVTVHSDGTKESTFSAGVRLVGDRLSFLDENQHEMAWFANRQMYIKQARITEFLQLGRYDVDTTDGVAWKWRAE